MTTQERAGHTDTARSAALMPGERCPAQCPACDAEYLAAAQRLLQANGYHVTRPRAAQSAARADGCTPGRPTGKGHNERCAEHFTVAGFRRAVCVLKVGSVADDGLPIGPGWTDREQVLSFALDCAKRQARAGDVLRAVRVRDAAARHGEHQAQARQFDGRTMRGMSGSHVSRDGDRLTYTGAPDCGDCGREYRSGARRAAVA